MKDTLWVFEGKKVPVMMSSQRCDFKSEKGRGFLIGGAVLWRSIARTGRDGEGRGVAVGGVMKKTNKKKRSSIPGESLLVPAATCPDSTSCWETTAGLWENVTTPTFFQKVF